MKNRRCSSYVLTVFGAFASLDCCAQANSQAPSELIECRERGGLPNFYAKLKRGSEVRIGYLGGSITAQAGWRPKSLAWFQQQFPQATLTEINAAIGGTGSDLGVFRLRHDVLEHHPDLLFVEFAVNDAGASVEQIHRCMEGIIRQTWRQEATTDICFVYTVAGNMLQELQQDRLPRSMTAMETLADFYHIPSINLGLGVARLEKEGKLIFKGDQPKSDAEKTALGDKILFSPDAVHPYPETGHQLYVEALARGMKKIETVGIAKPHTLADPFRTDNWEAAKMIPLSRLGLSPHWRRLDPSTNRLAKSFGQFLPELWTAGSAGDSLAFRFRGTVARFYDLMGPDCGQLSVQVDERAPRIQPRFDAYCTYHRLHSFPVADGLPDGVHTVRIAVYSEPPDKPKILSQRNEKMDDPKRFEGINWYAGAILLIGELIE